MEAAESRVFDYAEGTIWDKHERLRNKRVTACFVLTTFVTVNGRLLRREIYVDYGIFFDPDDEYLVAVLNSNVPEIDWSEMVFHRAMDSSRIFITPVDDFQEIAELKLRGADNRRALTCEELEEMGVAVMFPFQYDG